MKRSNILRPCPTLPTMISSAFVKYPFSSNSGCQTCQMVSNLKQRSKMTKDPAPSDSLDRPSID